MTTMTTTRKRIPSFLMNINKPKLVFSPDTTYVVHSQFFYLVMTKVVVPESPYLKTYVLKP